MTAEVAAQTTVVVAVWDRYVDGLLPKAIESLRAQDLGARIVVVDNASSVELPTLDGIDVVRVRRRATLGAARNVGLAQVSTPYVVFWDADDEMMPGTLAFLENAIMSDTSLAAFGAAIVEDTSGARHRWPRRWMSALAHAPRLFALVDCIWSLYPSTGSTILRTAYVREADGYFDAESGEDWCLGVSLAFRGRIGWSERPGRIYRLSGESVWAQHLGVHDQIDHARNVRRRIVADPGIAPWARRGLPLIAAGQYAAIAAHVLVATVRAIRR